jgi:hypothetical protein
VAEAMEIPVIDANTALAKTVAMPRPPVARRRSRWNTSNVSLPTPETVTRSPISTKSGTTAKRYSWSESLATAPSILSATSSFRISATPAKDTASIATPIGMPR